MRVVFQFKSCHSCRSVHLLSLSVFRHNNLTPRPGGSGSGAQGGAQGGPGTGGVSGNLTTQAAFEYRGTWIPLMTVSVQGSAKAT